MAYPSTRHYNLRSDRQEDLQTSDDANFLTDLVARQKAPIFAKVDPHTSSSGTE